MENPDPFEVPKVNPPQAPPLSPEVVYLALHAGVLGYLICSFGFSVLSGDYGSTMSKVFLTIESIVSPVLGVELYHRMRKLSNLLQDRR